MDNDLAKKRLEGDGGAVALLDWRSTVFLHFAVDPYLLQPGVPFPLDLHDDTAYVSLVTFDQRNFRLPVGGPLAHIVHFIGSNLFCNLRTYVQVNGEPGVFFLTEWVPNPLGALTAPVYPGLRYRLARLLFEEQDNRIRRAVFAAQGQLALEAEVPPGPYSLAAAGSVAEFCVERYTAFTRSPLGPVRFHIWHHPWELAETEAAVTDERLLMTRSWYGSAKSAGAQYSPGITGVQVGLPKPFRT